MRHNKFNAQRTEVDNIVFHSKKEARIYMDLKMERLAGGIKYFLMQVPFALPGKTKYLCDFQVFYADGRVRYIDCKGFRTREYLAKKRQVEALFPVRIEEEV